MCGKKYPHFCFMICDLSVFSIYQDFIFIHEFHVICSQNITFPNLLSKDKNLCARSADFPSLLIDVFKGIFTITLPVLSRVVCLYQDSQYFNYDNTISSFLGSSIIQNFVISSSSWSSFLLSATKWTKECLNLS